MDIYHIIGRLVVFFFLYGVLPFIVVLIFFSATTPSKEELEERMYKENLKRMGE